MAAVKSPLTQRQVQRLLQATFRHQKKKKPGEVNVVFVDNKTLRRLSRQFINKDHNTDVIAFPYDSMSLKGAGIPFGDIFVSLPMARTNARRFHVPFQEEASRLIVHGLLHLLGYSDHSQKEKAVMWKNQEEIVAHLFRKNR